MTSRLEMPELTGEERGQRDTIALMMDPATHGGAEVERVDTHISRLFLAGDRVFKLKRALATNYLDFSTPEAREASCRRELEVNAAAGEIYLGVVPITRDGGTLRLGGEGRAVDWVVEMRRFDRDQELDRLLEAGALDRRDMERLADLVAGMHGAAPVLAGYGNAEDTAARVDQIAGALADARGAEEGDAVEAWRRAARGALEAGAVLADRRAASGRVRRCHGDLHLGNIVMLDGRPTPFDAIEFNEEIASIDVLYDLALAACDLLMRGRRDLAAALLDRYLGATRDYAGLALWPLFVSMRGAVRAMSAASRGDREAADAALAFASDALAPRPAPRLVAVGGISGSGKSSVARELAEQVGPLTGGVVLRADVIRKRMHGVAPEEPLPEEAYTRGVNRRVLARLAGEARRVLRAGASAIMDTTFTDGDAADCADRLAWSVGVAFHGIWLDLSEDEAARRVGGRTGDASDATLDVVRAQAARARCPAGWERVDARGPLEEVVAEAARCL